MTEPGPTETDPLPRLGAARLSAPRTVRGAPHTVLRRSHPGRFGAPRRGFVGVEP